MTDTTEQKALALVNEVRVEAKRPPFDESLCGETFTALCRAIEQHEAFRQEVSDAVEQYWASLSGAFVAKPPPYMARFIIARPDPLVEVLNDLLWAYDDNGNAMADQLRAAMKARGYEWRKIGGEDHD